MIGLGHCVDNPNKLFNIQKVNSRWECEMENIKINPFLRYNETTLSSPIEQMENFP